MSEKSSTSYLLSLEKLLAIARENKCVRLLVKDLAANDNAKNQVYFGPGFESLNLIPNKGAYDASTATNAIFKADLEFRWISDDGTFETAPNAKLILYPQYPEVRFSGFLQGCRTAPSALFQPRKDGISQLGPRIFILVITVDGTVLAYAAPESSPIAKALLASNHPKIGVFNDATHLLSESASTRDSLLTELRKINGRGFIDSVKLNRDGTFSDCRSPNCGGYTLEAMLGITPNGFSEPDFLGWEVKQHRVTSFDNIDRAVNAGVITLMTPEPNIGFYREKGVEPFVRKFGYPDRLGRQDRLNFGGIHRVNERNNGTGLVMSLDGYDIETGKIVRGDGAVQLLAENGEVAAGWTFAGLLGHWNRKHAQAVYVPSMCRQEPNRQYAFGPRVRLGVGTDFMMYLKAMARGFVYYDPGIKLENVSTNPRSKRRSQFRIQSRSLHLLYSSFETVEL